MMKSTVRTNAMLAVLAAIAPSRFRPYAAANNATKPKKNRDKVKVARKQNRSRK